ncbi:unnamed protein product [Heterobilharzia americana]|nr:unnamed protein product [Heterobilharzia americana]
MKEASKSAYKNIEFDHCYEWRKHTDYAYTDPYLMNFYLPMEQTGGNSSKRSLSHTRIQCRTKKRWTNLLLPIETSSDENIIIADGKRIGELFKFIDKFSLFCSFLW